ncbi:amino acid adenylation domain-containing protein [Actinoplanes sp. NEAU-A12]|uniref:Amino acid adenylation domain-containing protein n=1 Tax=Actinoplanes sandaracinus TaxID=3045177 RepID=A0ABT6WTI5_9ACTN|nr:amino acid adenylation domain-containing protein [Actinoplanes sandaracinus]MDI6103009.1 amino acid adenylation domain-containing protein [Actinoplanes sandaracinus]
MNEPLVAPAEPATFPAAPAQQRLMLIEQMFPGTAAYHVPMAVRLRGDLDVDALAAAVQEIARRQEALRTVFATTEGVAVQVVLPEPDLSVEVHDLRGTAAATDERQLVTLLGERAREPFDLGRRLVRIAVYRLAADEHVLAVTMHHLISDMWSCGIFLRELGAAYPAVRAGARSPLPEPPVQYVDYAVWQRQNTDPERDRQLVEFWRSTLDGAPTLVELPADHTRPTVQTFRGDMHPVRLSPEVSRRITEVSRALGATPFMTVLAAFQAAVGRWVGSRDVVVSTGVATRTAQVEALIGCFINIVLFRTSLAGDPSFAELVGRVRRVVLDGFEHQDLPFERLVEEMAPQRDLSHQPLTQIMFVMQNAPMPVPTIGDLVVSSVHVPRHATQVDFDLQLWDAGDHFEGFIEYSSDLFAPATIARMWDEFLALLDAVTAAPDTRLSALPLLTSAELETTVSGWNATAADFPQRCLHELIEEQAARTPEQPAVLWPGGRLTYRELDDRAELVARVLRARGVGPETLVGSALGPGPQRLVAFLGILKASAGHLPLDPDYPAGRLTFMIEDAAPSVLLTSEDFAGRLAEVAAGVPVLRLEDLRDPGPVEPAPVDPDNLAYVIYTSGSTGRPKGIAVPHRGVVNNIVDLNRMGECGPGDRLLALSSASFDMSVYDMLGLLMVGGTVVLPDPVTAKDPNHWLDLVREHRITVWNSAPALLESLVAAAGPGSTALASLRLAFLGGDWVAVSLPERARRLAPGLRMVVMGGATEASIHSTVHEVHDVDPTWTSIPYGRAMANQQVLILDQDGQPAPVGVAGELHLGGVGVSRGYLRRPGLTAERFVPHPYAGRFPDVPAGARIYRTGDLARYRLDGEVELLGRLDHLTKIRGFRIEPGEVTSALLTHPAIDEGVVVCRTDTGEARLVAYVVPVDGAAPTVGELQDHLKGTLPDYMVPAAFVTLDRLPLSPNGKIDRAALPAVGTDRPMLAASYAEPTSPVERILAELWSAVLGIDRIGTRDDFFQLGGYSLAVTRLVALITETFTVAVPIRDAFTATTVAEQAALLERLGSEQGVQVSALAEMALEIEQLSEEEVAALLADEQEGPAWTSAH